MEHGVRVVDVDAGLEREFRDRRGVHVDEVPLRMRREEVAATGRAPLSLTAVGLLVAADLLLPLGDGDCVRLPQRECVEWRGGPASARTTVAVPCSHRLTGDRDLDCTTKALSLVDAHAILQRVSCKLQAGSFRVQASLDGGFVNPKHAVAESGSLLRRMLDSGPATLNVPLQRYCATVLTDSRSGTAPPHSATSRSRKAFASAFFPARSAALAAPS